MTLAITGATGLVGRFFVEEALARGEAVTVLGRTAPCPGFFSGPVVHMPYSLGDRPDLAGHAAVIHCAFAHLPGRYRGGEGDDPAGFIRRNLHGSLQLFAAAKAAGLQHLLFLSSRAVYGAYPPGTPLGEDLPPRPDTLYGRVKSQAEQVLFDLAAPGFVPISLRATGVYGPPAPGQRHKWADLFDDFRKGRPIAPRRATEVHGADVATAATLLRTADPSLVSARAFNLSDLVLDRRDLLALVAEAEGLAGELPACATSPVSVMRTDALHRLGWRPGGLPRLRTTLPSLL